MRSGDAALLGRTAVLLLFCSALFAEAPSPNVDEIVRRSVEVDLINFEVAKNYMFTVDTKTSKLDGKGGVRSVETETKDVFVLYGEPYSRITKKNGRALTDREERKEQEKLDKITREREKESPSQRAKRLAKYEKERQDEREFRREIPRAFDFKLVGSENVSGREAWILDATPKPSYRPKGMRAGILTKFKGRLWIDKALYTWVKVECESIDTVSFGLFLARLNKGAKLSFESTRVNDELWLPKRFSVFFDARLAVLKHERAQIDQVMSNYRKFQTESSIQIVSEKQ
jgi:hypothetical protein